MGRPKDSAKLKLTDLEGSALPELEFEMINEPNFTVPLESIKVKDSEVFLIPGLVTREVALTQKYLDLMNVFSVKVGFEAAVPLPMTQFVIKGSTSVQDLAALVHTKNGLNAGVELQLLADERVLPYDKLMCSVYKESLSSDGFVELVCRIVNGAAN